MFQLIKSIYIISYLYAYFHINIYIGKTSKEILRTFLESNAFLYRLCARNHWYACTCLKRHKGMYVCYVCMSCMSCMYVMYVCHVCMSCIYLCLCVCMWCLWFMWCMHVRMYACRSFHLCLLTQSFDVFINTHTFITLIIYSYIPEQRHVSSCIRNCICINLFEWKLTCC